MSVHLPVVLQWLHRPLPEAQRDAPSACPAENDRLPPWGSSQQDQPDRTTRAGEGERKRERERERERGGRKK